ncbi:MAG: hypothetical protein WBA51_10810 [Erythrobacter sp.]
MRYILLPTLLLAAAMALSGCDAPAEPDDAGHTESAHADQRDDESEGSDGIPGLGLPPELAEDGDDAGGTPEIAAVIPAAYHGVWDYEGGTCSPESDLRVEISGREVLFYESVGTVKAVAKDGEDTIVTLDMEGEGETWEQEIRLSLEGAGDEPDRVRLHTSDGEKPKIDDEYPSKKCLANSA